MQISLATIKAATGLSICHSTSCHRCREVFNTEVCPRDEMDAQNVAEEMIALYQILCKLCAEEDKVEISEIEIKNLLEI